MGQGGTDGDAPPSYNSIFGELRQQKSQSGGVVDYAKNATGLCCGKVAGVVSLVLALLCCVAFGLALPIAEIVIGSKYLDDCPAQKYLPIYLIVMGVFSILSGCTGGGAKASNRGEDEEEGGKKRTICSCCNSLFGLFLFAWFICGNVWVFRMQECGTEGAIAGNCFTKDEQFSNTTSYCKELVYEFVLWETVAKWVVCGVLMIAGFLCCCVMCCVYCCTGSSSDEN